MWVCKCVEEYFCVLNINIRFMLLILISESKNAGSLTAKKTFPVSNWTFCIKLTSINKSKNKLKPLKFVI